MQHSRFARKAKLTARNGLHSGMMTEISGAVKVGSDPASGVRLLDRQADGHTADIRLGLLSVSISPADGEVSVDGAPCKAPVRLWWFQHPTIDLRIGDIEASLDRVGLFDWPRMPVAGSLIAVLMLGGGALLSPTLTAAMAPKPATQTTDSTQMARQSQPLSDAVLGQKIAAELEAVGLGAIVAFELTAHEGRPLFVVTKGALSDAEMQRYRSFLTKYDQIGAAPPLRSEVEVTVLQEYPLPKIQMVQMQPEMAIIDMQGNVLGEGDRFIDGWEVVDISSDSFTLTRLGYTQVVELVEPQDETGDVTQ